MVGPNLMDVDAEWTSPDINAAGPVALHREPGCRVDPRRCSTTVGRFISFIAK
jgi:hypothetical protein